MAMNEVPVKEDMNMEQLLNEASPVNEVGALVTAYVVDVIPQGLLVDVGLKVEGFIPLSEFRSLLQPPQRGESFPVLIKRIDGPEGHPLVSWREARERVHWNRVLQAKEAQAPIEGTVVRQVKGGLILDIGLEGFLPASQIDRRPVKDTKAYIGQKVQVMVLEMDARKGNVVVSRRQFLEKEASKKQEDTLKTLEAGQVYTGTVTSLSSFGAFVDIGGVEGLLRIPDVSWGRVDKLSDVLSVGQTIDVKVLKYDPAARKIALGRKQLLPPPWDGVEERFPAGRRMSGRVTSLTDFGAFVELEPGVEGLIHQSEFSWKERWAKPQDFLQAGQTVEVQILSVSRAEEKIALSLKRVGENPWEQAAQLYTLGTRVKGTVTHLVSFGAFVRLPNGIEGLLRTEDISWTKLVHHPKDWVSVGQEIEVIVLEVSPSAERISLGLKQFHEDPFVRFKPGDIKSGKVARFTDFGAVVEIEPDVEGFVHLSEIPSEQKLNHPSEGLAIGQAVTAVVTKLQRKSKRIDLSIRKYEHKQERDLLKRYQGRKEGVTLGEMTDWGESPDPDKEPQ
ncbi:MAG: 30S ribosomal protein S1 [Elusimicrobia bacterium]|nr:30S ribosomal protein S1 [Elusimicrobiota bacterium]